MVIHNYGNPYEKWNIFVARPHLWLQLGMVKPEIMLCEMVPDIRQLSDFYVFQPDSAPAHRARETVDNGDPRVHSSYALATKQPGFKSGRL